MLDAGEKRIVRMGSRSKSERLMGYQLRTLARTKARQTNQNVKRLKQVEAQMHAQREAIERYIYEIQQPLQWNTPHGGVQQYLVDENPELLCFLSVPLAEKDFTVVGPGSSKLKPEDLWRRWYSGKSFPEFLESYVSGDLLENLLAFWSMPLTERHEMARQWKSDIIQTDVDQFIQHVGEFQSLCDERKAIRQTQDLQILKDARIIGATTTGAAQHKELLELKRPGIVIVEEAGEVLEPHILSALQAESTKHLILIGDHQQLRPKVETHQLTTVSGMGYNFDCSLFERLVLGGIPSVTLEVQHRMRPCISALIRSTYPNLVDHTSVESFPSLKGVNDDVVFIDHRRREDRCLEDDEGFSSNSRSNVFEVEMSVEIAKYFLFQGYNPGDIVILTPYLGQLKQIVARVRKELKDVTAFLSESDSRDLEKMEEKELEKERTEFHVKSMRCSSVDNFQGEESQIVIISLVRSNEKGDIGFLKEPQRVNVLLSRARRGIIVIGNSQTLRMSPKGRIVWEPLLDLFHRNGRLLDGLPSVCQKHPLDGSTILRNASDFREQRPNGGCTRLCGYRMNCGHSCPLMCHPYDIEHKSLPSQCSEPCMKVPPECTKGHRCLNLCKEPCGPCNEQVGSFQFLECRHWLDSVICHDVRDKAAIEKLSRRCKSEVVHKFSSCGHEVKTTCANATSERPCCPERCEGKAENCGHPCKNRCGECDGNHECNSVCERTLFCAHVCGRKCHSPGDCWPCEKPCVVSCSHSRCPKKCKKVVRARYHSFCFEVFVSSCLTVVSLIVH